MSFIFGIYFEYMIYEMLACIKLTYVNILKKFRIFINVNYI